MPISDLFIGGSALFCFCFGCCFVKLKAPAWLHVDEFEYKLFYVSLFCTFTIISFLFNIPASDGSSWVQVVWSVGPLPLGVMWKIIFVHLMGFGGRYAEVDKCIDEKVIAPSVVYLALGFLGRYSVEVKRIAENSDIDGLLVNLVSVYAWIGLVSSLLAWWRVLQEERG